MIFRTQFYKAHEHTKNFNRSLEKQRNRSNFDFQDKKVGFAYGNFGKGLISKKEYFNWWGKDYFENDSHVFNQLIILTEEEKEESGGYDAIIISWSKTGVYGRQKERLIKKLIEAANRVDGREL